MRFGLGGRGGAGVGELLVGVVGLALRFLGRLLRVDQGNLVVLARGVSSWTPTGPSPRASPCRPRSVSERERPTRAISARIPRNET
eukprot:COSAG04_NODE_2576_length_3906_cov_2.988705_3_plen_86_part_00